MNRLRLLDISVGCTQQITLFVRLCFISCIGLQCISASVIGPVISFGVADGTNQDFDNGTYDNDANTYVSAPVIGHSDDSFEGRVGSEFNFEFNDEAQMILEIQGSDDVVSGNSGNRIGIGNEWLDGGESFTLTLTLNVNSGFTIQGLYMDYLKISNWAPNAALTLGDGSVTTTAYTYSNGDSSEQIFRYQATPASNASNDPIWRAANADLNTIAGLATLSSGNIGGYGTDTWQLTVTNTGTDDLALDELSIYFQVVEVPEPSIAPLVIGLGAFALFLCRRRF